MKFVGVDPSTKTGFVLLDSSGEVLIKQEVLLENGIKSTEQELLEYGRKIVSLVPEDAVVCVEDFSFGSKGMAVSTQYAIGFSIRFALVDRGIAFYKPTPSQLKKFATSKGNTTKDNMTIPIYRLWNFEHKSDNVRDAFVLAQIARGLVQNDAGMLGQNHFTYQLEVLSAIRNPEKKQKKR